MTVCGHQFHGGDEADWVLSTSAGCLDGSTTATRILQELFRKHSRKTSTKRPNTPNTPPKITPIQHSPPKPQPHNTLIVTKIPSSSSFDHSQHLNGCPIKWLYNKRHSQRNRHPPPDRLCSLNIPLKEHTRERPSNVRDRTPVEVKVHKINLTEKYTTDSTEVRLEGPTDFDARRKNLAAKLNWKLHDDSPDDRSLDADTSRHDFFPPRPLLGLKPLLSVLLTPHRTDCCCLVTPLPRTAASSPPGRKPSLSVQCLHFPLPLEDSRPRPRTTNGLRWGSKPRTNKLQIPPQVTIKLEQKKQKSVPGRESASKVVHSSPRPKRSSERGKERKSLECLFYELRGKANEEVLEEMIRELSTEGQYKMKRFLKLGGRSGGPGGVCELGRRERQVEGSVGTSESNPVCGKVRFFRKGAGKEGVSGGGDLGGSVGQRRKRRGSEAESGGSA